MLNYSNLLIFISVAAVSLLNGCKGGTELAQSSQSACASSSADSSCKSTGSTNLTKVVETKVIKESTETVKWKLQEISGAAVSFPPGSFTGNMSLSVTMELDPVTNKVVALNIVGDQTLLKDITLTLPKAFLEKFSVANLLKYGANLVTDTGVETISASKIQATEDGGASILISKWGKLYGRDATNGGSSSSLAAPTNVAGTAGNAQIAITWTAVSGAESYNVYYGTSAGVSKSTSAKRAASSTPLTLTGLINATAYSFAVTAVSGSDESSLSTEVSATPVIAVPAAATGLTVTAGTSSNTISWAAASTATSYNLYYSTTSPVTTSGTKLTGVTSPYTHSSLTPGTRYYYALAAVNAGGEGALTSTQNGCVNALPYNGTATVNSFYLSTFNYSGNSQWIARGPDGKLWTALDTAATTLTVKTSIDGGQTWTTDTTFAKASALIGRGIIVGPDGTVHLFRQTAANTITYVRKTTSSGWGSDETVTTTGKQLEYSVDVAANGTLHFVYTDTAASQIYYTSRTTAGSWAAATNLSGKAMAQSYPRIAIGSDGTTVHVIWYGLSWPGAGTYYLVYTTIGGSPGALLDTTLGTFNQFHAPSLTAGANGTLYVTLFNGAGLSIMRYVSGSWTAATQIDAAGYTADVAESADGVPHVYYETQLVLNSGNDYYWRIEERIISSGSLGAARIVNAYQASPGTNMGRYNFSLLKSSPINTYRNMATGSAHLSWSNGSNWEFISDSSSTFTATCSN